VVRVGARLPDGGLRTAGRSPAGALLADRVLVEPGRAALVDARSAPEAASGTLHLVTDQGVRHGLPGDEVLAMLGYPRDRAVRLPASLLDRVPAGPALDPETARRNIVG
jgi:hypothetical protein